MQARLRFLSQTLARVGRVEVGQGLVMACVVLAGCVCGEAIDWASAVNCDAIATDVHVLLQQNAGMENSKGIVERKK